MTTVATWWRPPSSCRACWSRASISIATRAAEREDSRRPSPASGKPWSGTGTGKRPDPQLSLLALVTRLWLLHSSPADRVERDDDRATCWPSPRLPIPFPPACITPAGQVSRTRCCAIGRIGAALRKAITTSMAHLLRHKFDVGVGQWGRTVLHPLSFMDLTRAASATATPTTSRTIATSP